MSRQGTCCLIRITLGAAGLQPESLLVRDSLSNHPEDVRLRVVDPYRALRLLHHTHSRYHIGAHPILVKQLRQDVERPLKAVYLC